MYHIQGPSKQQCRLLAVICGNYEEKKGDELGGESGISRYRFPGLVSSGRLEVQSLVNPVCDEFREAQKLAQPNILYFQGEKLENGEVGGLNWGGLEMEDPEMLSSLIAPGPALPTIVYLEVPNSELVAKAVHSKGVPYVIYWKDRFSPYAASHFRQALFSVVQSSRSHTWDAFQLALASFRLYCVRNNQVFPGNTQKTNGKLGPCLLGDAPKININNALKININPPERDTSEEEGPSEALPAMKIYDEHVDMRFLVCGVPCILDACLLGSLEDGLNALLHIEIRGSRLQNRVSATPPIQAGTFTRGVVTMRCDLTTCSSSHISLLVSGSAQTCSDDQLLESHIKKELIEKSQLAHALPNCEESKSSLPDPLSCASIACGASVFEVSMRVPAWAAQVLKHLAPEMSYRSLVALGVASIQGTPVASFEKEDTDRLLFFCTNQGKDLLMEDRIYCRPPRWSANLISNRRKPGQVSKPITKSVTTIGENGVAYAKGEQGENGEKLTKGFDVPSLPARKRLRAAVMKPIPHTRHYRMLLFIRETNGVDASQVKPIPVVPVKHNVLPLAPTHRKSTSSSFHKQQIVPLNPLPMKKHGCDRPPIQVCKEGVGNTLKRHYETYLLEYELAHDDVGGECCLLCHSSAPGDWVNCGVCGEWAHFGCDGRPRLGTFKEYAKTDGLEYICPHCSLANKRRTQKTANGLCRASPAVPRVF